MALSKRVKKADPKPAATAAHKAADDRPRPAFLKRGNAAHAAKREEATRAAARSNFGERRFYIKVGEAHDANEDGPTVTLLDGDLIQSGEEKGQLDLVTFREHEIRPPGSKMPDYYICLSDTGEECPLCAFDQYYFAAAFSIIDHRTIKTKKGDVVDERKLLVVKQTTMDLLTKYATQAGGLAGLQFEVSRGQDQRSPKVGDLWIPLNAHERATQDELTEAFGEKAEPLDYEKALNFKTAAELAALGVSGDAAGGAVEGSGDADMPDSGEDAGYDNPPEDIPAQV